MHDTILVTGGAGFIGSNFVLSWIGDRRHAGRQSRSADLCGQSGQPGLARGRCPRYMLVRGDICDAELVGSLLREHQPRAIVHFAAESHVDRSIASPGAFIRTNVHGTFVLLEQAKALLVGAERSGSRSVSAFCTFRRTKFTARWGRTIRLSARPRPTRPTALMRLRRPAPTTWCGPTTTPTDLPVLTTNCSNNYGPFQFPEKLIPLMILNALEGKPLPVYGDGRNVRDWLFVEDHCAAIRDGACEMAASGETYNIGGNSERTNIDVVTTICDLVDEMRPRCGNRPRAEADHLCHGSARPRPPLCHRRDKDLARTGMAAGGASLKAGCARRFAGISTIPQWVESVRTGAYLEWIGQNYTERVAL